MNIVKPSAVKTGQPSPAAVLIGGPTLTGSPKIKSAFAAVVLIANAKTNASKITFFILFLLSKNDDVCVTHSA
jgi:hypothetical protein